MTRVFLAAGVAALAITAPATAGPHANKTEQTTAKQERGQRTQRVQQRTERAASQRVERTQRVAAQRPQRTERMQMRAERQQVRAERVRPARIERTQARVVERQQVRAERVRPARIADRQQTRAGRVERVQNRQIERQQMHANRVEQAQNRALNRQQLRADRIDNRLANQGAGYGVGGCPPGLAKKAVACMPPGQAAKQGLAPFVNRANVDGLRAVRVEALNRRYGTRLLAPATAATLLGMPVTRAATFTAFNPLPQSVSYLYPDTPNYYYRYGDGYLYQVDRGSNLIAALLPLLAGGYMPGSYLPTSYMNSYVPDYYGLNSFYPASYGSGYGYGYDNLCNRYANGVIYQVDCVTGMVEDVIPMYAGGYGVGQMLPSAYSTYNVPYQYRSLYYDTPDYNYWYAPGAIYQYDRSSSLITSVAALLSPGFAVGQPLPIGYSTYNVPYDYRATYYDTPDAWYRYNNGYIYQVDPTTQLVSAIVASILT